MTTITQAQINKVTDKVTGKVFYSVKSDSSDTYYRMTWSEQATQWECNCPSYKPCKHLRALQEVLKAKRAASETVKGTLSSNAAERKMEVAPSGNKVWMR